MDTTNPSNVLGQKRKLDDLYFSEGNVNAYEDFHPPAKHARQETTRDTYSKESLDAGPPSLDKTNNKQGTIQQQASSEFNASSLVSFLQGGAVLYTRPQAATPTTSTTIPSSEKQQLQQPTTATTQHVQLPTETPKIPAPHEIVRPTKRNLTLYYLKEVENFTLEDVNQATRKRIDVDTKAVYGPIDNISVGNIVYTRQELYNSRLHLDMYQNVCTNGDCTKPATSVLVNDFEEHDDRGNLIVFEGEPAPPGDGYSQEPVLTGSNLALSRNAQLKIPVRLIRSGTGTAAEMPSCFKSVYAPLKGYRYDGVYFVGDFWFEKNTKGQWIYVFKLIRVYGQPTLNSLSQSTVPQNIQDYYLENGLYKDVLEERKRPGPPEEASNQTTVNKGQAIIEQTTRDPTYIAHHLKEYLTPLTNLRSDYAHATGFGGFRQEQTRPAGFYSNTLDRPILPPSLPSHTRDTYFDRGNNAQQRSYPDYPNIPTPTPRRGYYNQQQQPNYQQQSAYQPPYQQQQQQQQSYHGQFNDNRTAHPLYNQPPPSSTTSSAPLSHNQVKEMLASLRAKNQPNAFNNLPMAADLPSLPPASLPSSSMSNETGSDAGSAVTSRNKSFFWNLEDARRQLEEADRMAAERKQKSQSKKSRTISSKGKEKRTSSVHGQQIQQQQNQPSPPSGNEEPSTASTIASGSNDS